MMVPTRLLPVLAATATIGLLVAATPAVASPGQLDASYGQAGTVSFPSRNHSSVSGTLLAASPAGTVIAQNQSLTGATGGSPSRVLLRRLDAHGVLDPAFGTAGSTVLDTGQPTFLRDLTVTAEGNVDVLLSVGDGSFGPPQVGLARLLADGLPDSTFGGSGMIVEPPVDDRAPVALLSRPGGAFLVGFGENGQGLSDFTTQSYDEGGNPLGPVATVDLGGYDVLTDLVEGPSGSYFAVGYSAKPAGQSAAAVKVQTTGALDPTFGAGGIARVTSRSRALATVGAVTSGTSLLLFGAAQSGQDFDAFVTRLTATGQLATGFGSHGLLLLGSPGSLETATAVAPGSADAVLVSVSVQIGSVTGFLTLVSLRSGAVVPGFGTGGRVTLPDKSFDVLLPDGSGTLMAGTRATSGGPVDIVQRRLDS